MVIQHFSSKTRGKNTITDPILKWL